MPSSANIVRSALSDAAELASGRFPDTSKGWKDLAGTLECNLQCIVNRIRRHRESDSHYPCPHLIELCQILAEGSSILPPKS